MTPYALLMPTTPPPASSTPVKESKSYIIDDSARIARRDGNAKRASASDRSSKIQIKDDQKDIASTDPTLFEQLMASLLNMPSPAQTQATVTVRPTGDNNVTASSTGQFGSAFNMDPAMLVIPQSVSSAAIPAPAKDGSGFNAELLAALTPGIPAPTTDQTTLMSQIEVAATANATVAAQVVTIPTPAPVAISVPVPVISEEAVTTPLLTVTNEIDADPRLIACGFDPAQMEKLKAKLAFAANVQTSVQTSAQTVVENPALQIPAVKTSSAQSMQVATDSGVISVNFTMPKPQPVVQTPAPAQPVVQVQPTIIDSAIKITQNIEAALSTSVAADANIKADAASAKISDAAAQAAILSSESGGDNFDPVEFRIAQSFQRPVTTPAPVAQNPSGTTVPAQTASATGVSVTMPQTHFQHAVNASINGHATTMNNDASSSLMSSLLSPSLDAAAGDTTLTVSPAALPVTVSPLTSTVIQSTTAAQSHPAIQAVAAVIAKNAKEGGAQTISMRLDPPELGKLQVEMKYKKGDPLKVHVVLEKADTASMFARDAHALESTLKEAGLQLDGSSLSFEFSGDNAFQQALQGDGGNTISTASSQTGSLDTTPIEATPDIYTDIKTGITHYNLRV